VRLVGFIVSRKASVGLAATAHTEHLDAKTFAVIRSGFQLRTCRVTLPLRPPGFKTQVLGTGSTTEYFRSPLEIYRFTSASFVTPEVKDVLLHAMKL
jgi:hypothetical protein